MKRILWLFIVLISFVIVSCNKEKEDPQTDIEKSIVINELMPKNSQYGQDQNGEYDDWIELYNLSNQDIDISGYFLTDSKNKLTKWKLPVGTKLAKNGYLIIWADGDSTTQAGLHTNYKLSALGETVLLITPDMNVIEEVKYQATSSQKSWARMPNGTGDFSWSTPTFGVENK